MPSNMPSATVKEHYVPQFYLSNFSIPGEHGTVYSLEATEINPGPRKYAVSSLCFSDDLYESQYGGQYILHNETEHLFSKFESQQKKLIDKIIEVASHHENFNTALILKKEEKDILFQFIAQLYFRNKTTYERMFNNLKGSVLGKDEWGLMMNAFLKQALNRTIVPTNELRKHEGFQVESFSNELSDFKFHFCYTSKAFITSNFPIACFPTENECLEIWVPLSTHIGVLFTSKESANITNRLIDYTRHTEALNQRLFHAPSINYSNKVTLIASEKQTLLNVYNQNS